MTQKIQQQQPQAQKSGNTDKTRSVHHAGVGNLTRVHVREADLHLLSCTSCGKSNEYMVRLNGGAYYCNITCVMGRCFDQQPPKPQVTSRAALIGGKSVYI
jgi:hypothetical protein